MYVCMCVCVCVYETDNVFLKKKMSPYRQAQMQVQREQQSRDAAPANGDDADSGATVELIDENSGNADKNGNADDVSDINSTDWFLI